MGGHDNRRVPRHADPSRDAAACAAIYAPYVADGVASFEAVAPDAGEMGRRITAWAATHAFLVSERDGRVTGFAYACPHRERAAYRWSADVSVYVAGSAHRSGVGAELYRSLLDLLRRQGIRRVHAGVTLPNPASVGLHEAFGFVPVGVYRKVGYKFGRWHDVGWWQLDLAPDEPVDAVPGEPLGPQRLRPTDPDPRSSGTSDVA